MGQGVLLMIALTALGAVLLHWTEGTSAIDSTYWAISTLSTVGYGAASMRQCYVPKLREKH